MSHESRARTSFRVTFAPTNEGNHGVLYTSKSVSTNTHRHSKMLVLKDLHPAGLESTRAKNHAEGALPGPSLSTSTGESFLGYFSAASPGETAVDLPTRQPWPR